MDVSGIVDVLIGAQRSLYNGMTAGLKSADGAAGFAAMMAASFMFGCVHALMPGHGKSVLASYHLGQPSRIAQGAASAVLLSITHVGLAALLVLLGFKVIGVSLAAAGRAPAFETVSAALIMAIGLYLAARAFYPKSEPHHHGDGRALAIAAGLIPCPLTTFVLTYGIVNGRLAAGAAAIVAMLAGISTTLTIVAVGAVLFRERCVEGLRRFAPIQRRLAFGAEITSAVLIVDAGVIMLLRSANAF